MIELDGSDLNSITNLTDSIAKTIETSSRVLAQQAINHATQLAHERLHSRKDAFLNALDLKEENGAYLVILKPSANWIEEGLEPYDMIETLLRSSKAKTSKDGSKYLAIPFKHMSSDKSPQRPLEVSLQNIIQDELKKNNISLDIERNIYGKPKTGLLHRINIQSPIMRGGLGSRLLDGVSIFQRSTSTGTVKEALTFRTISNKGSSSANWHHPGLEPSNIFDDTARWVEEQWEKISQEIIKQL